MTIQLEISTSGPVPLIAIDVDLLLETPLPRVKLLSKWTKRKLLPVIDAEYMCIKLRKVANIALLSQYEFWQNDLIKETVAVECYNYLIPVRCKDEFELFRDTMLPYTIYSNIPKMLWEEDYTGTYTYYKDKWTEVFDSIKQEVPFECA